ncbi:hypothetical protein FP2506_17194 [Fulvimarina pelagi HTCC2506]|uniref:Uncharacterized protein n=1 Tax=Fulvimarina pelagi HTCC2506 TaxID=314231 RepID=Q0G2J1_9HYPH|nr:hypothetical protein FP2506_17194 [Fulvimarina pelagi HTCC2506]
MIPTLMRYRRQALDAGNDILAFLLMLAVLAAYDDGFEDNPE